MLEGLIKVMGYAEHSDASKEMWTFLKGTCVEMLQACLVVSN